MTTQWASVKSKDSSIERFTATNRRAEAWIKRNPDDSVDAGAKNGLFGLGLRTESHFFAPAPSDEVILDRLDSSANPPRFDNWEKSDKTTPGTNYYEGEADNLSNSTVKVAITRVGDEADVKAK